MPMVFNAFVYAFVLKTQESSRLRLAATIMPPTALHSRFDWLPSVSERNIVGACSDHDVSMGRVDG